MREEEYLVGIKVKYEILYYYDFKKRKTNLWFGNLCFAYFLLLIRGNDFTKDLHKLIWGYLPK